MIKNLGHMFALFELSTPKQQGAGRVDNFYQNALQVVHDLIFACMKKIFICIKKILRFIFNIKILVFNENFLAFLAFYLVGQLLEPQDKKKD